LKPQTKAQPGLHQTTENNREEKNIAIPLNYLQGYLFSPIPTN
jgi:hypothetical protein